MGIYVFKPEMLEKTLNEHPDMDDFGHDILPAVLDKCNVKAFYFNDYWADIGTISAFYEANLALTSINPPFSFSEGKNPIYTHPRFLPGTRIENTQVTNSFLADGGFVQASDVQNSIVGLRSRIGREVSINKAILMGADYYQSPEDRKQDMDQGVIPIGIGDRTRISNAIIDKNARIGSDVVIGEKNYEGDSDHDTYFIRDGIVVLPKNSVIPNGTVI
jgi:glucose-1-phosphate adenylyltransferase